MAGASRYQVLCIIAVAALGTSAWTQVVGILAGAQAPVLDPAAPVVDASLKDPLAGIPSGGWATIRGTNLAPLTRSWTDADFQANRAPVSMEGVSVSAGGKAAFIAALRRRADSGSAGDEIDVVLPSLPEGSAGLTVTTPGGTSETVAIRVVALQPSFFAHDAASGRYAKGESSDGEEMAGPLDLFGSQPLDRPVRPAIPAEILRLAANGCGVFEPPVEDGVRTDQRRPLALPAVVKFGEQEAEVLYAGAASRMPGQCQLEVRVPLLATGEYELTGSIGETSFAAGRYVVIQEVEYPGFDHGAQSKFRLTGAHHFVTCTGCHARSRFWGTPQACEACHMDRFRATSSPDHQASGFPFDCSQCHVTSRFKGARGGHAASSPFPLTGRHAEVTCAACHKSGEYEQLEKACVSCHLSDYEATANPNHASTGIGKECSVCHTPGGWQGARTDHSQTQFPLTGKHAKAACSACHKAELSGKPATACVSCHKADYLAAANPNHPAAGYPTGCDACHTTEAFRPAKVDHPRQRFPLTGKHAPLQCAQCHADGQLTAIDAACSSCHLDRYKTAVNPNHLALGFPQTCETCHTTAGFAGASIKHDKFALTGRHTQTACTACHRANVYAGTSRVCSGCHLDRYNATTNPPHAATGYPTECQLCHSTSQFTGALFQHSNFFALTGKHATVPCRQCHVNGVYKGTARSCAGCHAAAFAATTAPSHTTLGFPQSCENCHSPAGWKPATFVHSSFALLGKHLTTGCSMCHVSGLYAGTTRECYGCHAASFNAAATPNHTALGYPASCQMCHTPAGWRPSPFTHASYPLTGRHLSAQCSKCHVPGVYAGTTRQCYGCHAANFAAALLPNHTLLGYPTGCQMCHTPAGWKPSTFLHPASIMTGAHTTATCSQCHANGQYAGTSTLCASCHLSDYNAALLPNHALQVYPLACQTCHTTTAWLPASFTHGFPIFTGRHRTKWSKCTDCHIQPANFKVFSCFSCHLKTKMDEEHKEVSGYAYDSVLCYQCHPQGRVR